MKYLSLDLETTGLDENYCQILSVGGVIEDTSKKLSLNEIPKFHVVIVRDRIQGEPFALNMNKKLIELINLYNISSVNQRVELAKVNDVVFIREDELVDALNAFTKAHGFNGKITVAGKNYTGFDKKFLDLVPGWDRLNIHRRVIDPATSFVDWQNDIELPDLKTCKERAGVSGEVTHNALEDAFDVVNVLRTKY